MEGPIPHLAILSRQIGFADFIIFSVVVPPVVMNPSGITAGNVPDAVPLVVDGPIHVGFAKTVQPIRHELGGVINYDG